MKKSSHPEITIVDHFDDLSAAIRRKTNTPPVAAAAADPAPAEAYVEPPAVAPPRISPQAFPPDPAKPIPQPDWMAIFARPLDFSALARNLARPMPPLPDRQTGFADLFGPHPPTNPAIKR
jgi:hypothetical protein